MARISTGLFKAWLRKEAAYGTYPADMDTNSRLLYITAPNVSVVPTKEEDPALLGNQFPADFVTVNKIVSGSYGFSAHPEGLGLAIYFHLGKVTQTTNAPTGSLCIFYSGAAESCKISVVAGVLNVAVGLEGAEILDVNFNTTGLMDFSNPLYNTIDKCVALINTFPGYRAYKVGSGSASTALISQQPTPTIGYAEIANTGTLGAFTGATVPALPSSTYDLDITIDGTPHQTATALLITDDWTGIAAKIQADLQGLTGSTETVTIEAGKIRVTSATAGVTSTVIIAAGTAGSAGGDLLAAIDGIGATYVTDLETPVDGTAGVFGRLQAKGTTIQSRTVKLDAIDPATSVYQHRIGSMGIGENADSFTYAQYLGLSDVQAFLGCKGGQLAMDFPNGGLVTGTSNLIGKEMQSKPIPAMTTFEGTKPQISGRVQLYINGQAFGYNEVSLDYNPNLFAEVEGGSLFQGEAQNGKKINMSISPMFHWYADTETGIYDRLQNDERVEAVLVCEHTDEADTGITYSQFWRMATCQITESTPDAGGEVFNLPSKLDVLQPVSTDYRPVECEVISTYADLGA